MIHYRLLSSRSCNHATKFLDTHCWFSTNRDEAVVLHTRAVRIDEIDRLGWSYYEQLASSTKPTDRMTQSTGVLNGYLSNASLREAVWRTLVSNRTPTGGQVPEDYHLLLDCVPETGEKAERTWRGLKAFSRLVNQNFDFCVSGQGLGSFFPSDRTTIDNPEAARDPMGRMFRYLRTRRLMTTKTGFLGMAPNQSQQGDCILILLGCNVPLVLRPWGGQQYKVVGGCYLHGFMEGETANKVFSTELHTEEIVLL